MTQTKFLRFISLLLACVSVCYGFLPEPRGPFYGFPYSSQVARWLPIPATAYGICQKGTIYKVTSVSDLKASDAQLQCIFAAGLPPSKIPSGPMPGSILTTLNSRHTLGLNNLFSLWWKGNFAVGGDCGDSNTTSLHITFRNVRNRVTSPGLTQIGSLVGYSFAPGEFEDGKEYIIIDNTKDIPKLCPDLNLEKMPGIQLPSNLVNVYPRSQLVEAYRLVGRAEDGRSIFLGKTYFRDLFRSDKQLASVAFWTLTSKDEEVNPEFGPGAELPPLDCSFDYMFPGGVDYLLRYSPLDNIVTRPVDTLLGIGGGVRRGLRNYWSKFRDYLRLIGKHTSNRSRLREFFRNSKLGESESPRREGRFRNFFRRPRNSPVFESSEENEINSGEEVTTISTDVSVEGTTHVVCGDFGENNNEEEVTTTTMITSPEDTTSTSDQKSESHKVQK